MASADNGDGRAFTESFGAAAMDTNRWGVGSLLTDNDGSASGTVSQTSGQLQVSPEASVNATRVRGAVTRDYFDFIPGKTATVKVVQTATTPAETYLIIGSDPNTFYGITRTGSFLVFSGKGFGSTQQYASVTYNAVNHLYWRLRFSAGTMYAETSPDGTTWNLLGSAANAAALFAPNRVRVSLESGIYSSVASPGTAIFDDFSIQ